MKVLFDRQLLPEKLRAWLAESEWSFASENHDDDFHTDILFLRTSCGAMREFAGVANDSVLSVHDGFSGKFFYPTRNNREVIRQMVERFLGDRAFRESIVPETLRASRALVDVWAGLESRQALCALSWERLRELYHEQLERHLRLYRPAWTAEALQAAGIGLTETLTRFLTERSVGERLFEVFTALTTPEEPSAHGQSRQALLRLAETLLAQAPVRERILRSPKHGKFHLEGEILRELRALSAGIGFFGYHGFSARRRDSEEDLLDQLVALVSDPDLRAKEAGIFEKRGLLLAAKRRWHKELDLTPEEISWFDTYGALGNAKVSRRLSQLKNFYFLDALLRELVVRVPQVTEAHLRYMTPEELLEALASQGRSLERARFREELLERFRGMAYLSHQGEEYLLLGEASEWAKQCVAAQSRRRVAVAPEGRELRGLPVSGGIARGRALLAVRLDEALRARFHPGDILVSVETDPDLVPLMRQAGAIVTDQGGITSHAAMVAREIGVPCVTGVGVATARIRDGDLLHVDADRGVVELLEPPGSSSIVLLGQEREVTQESIGPKAYQLHRLARAQGPVAPGLVLCEGEGAGEVSREEIESALHQLPEVPGIRAGLWAIRSSASCEDGEDYSQAGRFETRLDVPTEEVVRTVRQMRLSRKEHYRGVEGGQARYALHLLLMRMVDATQSGVLLTKDPRTASSPAGGRGEGPMLLETVAGGCEPLVAGRVTPAVAHLEASGPGSGESTLSPTQLERLQREVASLKKHFGHLGELDIEFSFAKERLFILQVRPLSRAQGGPSGGRP